MKNAVILHGKPSRERYENPELRKPHEANWLPWIGEQLSFRGVEVSIPVMPKPYFPIYKDWKTVFEQNYVDGATSLIGHSAGAEFILRWLAENESTEVEAVTLVAPYHDFGQKYGDFSQYELDSDIVNRIGKLTIVNSLDDDVPIQKSVQRLTALIPGVHLVELDGFGHFRIGHNMHNEEFPELLEVLQNR